MGGFYINFYFKNIEYDDGFYGGEFSSPDSDVYCEFLYDRKAKEFIDMGIDTILTNDYGIISDEIKKYCN